MTSMLSTSPYLRLFFEVTTRSCVRAAARKFYSNLSMMGNEHLALDALTEPPCPYRHRELSARTGRQVSSREGMNIT